MLIYGKQPTYYIIDNYPQKIRTLYLAKELEKKEYSRFMKMGYEVKRIPPNAAQTMCKGGSHQGFLAEVDDIKLVSYKDFLNYDFVLVLSSITDIGNIGAIVRTAYALGVDAIIACGVKKLPLDAIVRTSTGALFDMPFAIEANIHNVMNDLKTSGFTTYGADMGAKDIREVSPASKKALFLGSEGDGLTARVSSKLDEVVSIEMEHKFDSLNVSVAGAILIDRLRG